MFRRRKFWRQVVSLLLTVLVVTGGMLQTVRAEGTTEAEPAAPQETPNVTGGLTQGGASLPGITFSMRTTDADTWYDITTDEEGKFSLYLPDGSYLLSGIYLPSEPRWYPLDRTVTIENGVLQGGTSLNIDLPAKLGMNVEGLLTKNGQPLQNVTFSVHTTEESAQWFDTTSESDGTFKFTLPDGEYKVEGVWVEADSHWYPLGQTFKVATGKLEGVEKLSLALTTPVEQAKYQVSGTLTQSGQPLNDILFSLRSTGEEEEWYSASTNQEGQFMFELPAGEYEIIGIWVTTESKWHILNKTFSVSENTVQDIELPAPPVQTEISGVLTKGETGLANIGFSVHTTGDDPVWYDIQTNDTGSFILKGLPDGDYQLDGVWLAEESKWYLLKLKFTVQDGILTGSDTLAVDLQDLVKTVNGRILKGETPVADVWVSAHTIGENEIWYDVKTNANGAFEFQLPDGDYRIEGVWVGSEETWYPKPVDFTVVDGKLVGQTELELQIEEEKDPLTGTVLDAGNPVANGTVYIENVTNSDDYYGFNTDSNGKYSFQLPDGDYHVVSVSAPNLPETLYVYKKFSVKEGKLLLEGAAAQTLDVTLPPKSLTVEISKGGSTIRPTNGVHIFSTEHGFGYWAFPDSSGRVSYRVPDGTYEVEGYYANDGFYTYLHQKVEVKNGTTNPNPFVIQIENNDMLKGKVKDENGPVANAEFIIEDTLNYFQYWVQAGADGSYSINVPDGDYLIHEITKGNTSYGAVDINFKVKDGKVSVNGQEKTTFDITLPGKTLNGQLLAGGTPLSGEIYFERIINGMLYYYSGKTDSSGKFAFRVPDGVYTITSVSANDGSWYAVNTTVNISNGTTSPNPLLIDVDQGNVRGTLVDENGPAADADFFIDSVDGNSYYWVVTDENGSFSTFIPDGDYYIHGVWTGIEENYVDVFFSVVNGKVQLNGTPADELNLTIPGETLKAQIVSAAGEIFGGREVNGIYLSYFGMTDTDGRFALKVPDGVYTIEQLYGAVGLIDVYQDIEVKDGTTNPSPYLIEISDLGGF
nr:carboxypeptidase-like regulatory domain-containing protein [Neobacillus sp. Marseille-Q6967]